MHKLFLSGVMAAGMLLGFGTAAQADHHMMPAGDVAAACMERTPWSEETCACVAEKAADQLTMGQTALLLSYGDGELNYFSTAREYDVSLGERIEVHGFVRFTAPGCALNH